MTSRARPGRTDKDDGSGNLLARLLDAADHLIFRGPDLDATVRGWEVRRKRRFHRTYRDPWWNLISCCSECSGTGNAGTRTCPACAGAGTVRADTVEARPS